MSGHVYNALTWALWWAAGTLAGALVAMPLADASPTWAGLAVTLGSFAGGAVAMRRARVDAP